jgi:RNA polymerase sigma-54 factor
MVRRARKAVDTRYLKSSFNRANSFLEDLNRRHETILRVARTLVMHQQSFLEHGEQVMKPLTLREVAESLELHESTVSRACSRKYIMTPRGTFELKYLFSYRIRSDIGEDESALSIKHKLLRLVEQEDGRSPLSDQQITEQLRGSGIRIARRTVAKYRSSMHIPTRRKRKAIAINQMPNREVM